MKSTPHCNACFLRQAGHAAELAGLDSTAGERILAAVAAELERLPAQAPPPVKASRVHALIREASGHPDPYQGEKRRATEQALALYPALRRLVAEADDPFATAVRLSIAGNIIDLGVGRDYDLEASIQRVLRGELAIDHLERLRTALAGAHSVLYLADNAGETVFDRLLIERLDRPVTYVVKAGPAVNDATREDALAAGLGECCEIIDHGAATLGTLPERCSEDFRRRFAAADLIIAKGMANFEGLNGSRRGLFFLLQTKCAVVSEHLGIPERSLVVLEDGPADDVPDRVGG